MKILALDSSGMTAAVAVAENEKIIASYSVNNKKTHSQTLLPMLEEVTKMISLDLASIDAIALAAGPGSFTGLRIGGATAKGLGFALDKPIIAVPTLEGLAWNGWGFDGVICVGATGIAVRLAAPLLGDKCTDPALVAVDERGRFAVSLAGGHLGGANRLARRTARVTGGQAVISTGTDCESLTAFDEAASREGCRILNAEAILPASRALMEGKDVSFSGPEEIYRKYWAECPNVRRGGWTGGPCVLWDTEKAPEGASQVLFVSSRSLVLGLGCRKGVDPGAFAEEAMAFLQRHGVSPSRLAGIASIDLKRDEPAILSLREKLGVPELFFYPADFTFVCPTELEDLAAKYEDFKNAGCEIYSVSCDTAFVHKAWHDASEKIRKIAYPMLADPTHALSRDFEVYIETDGVAERGTFIVNPEGRIAAYEVSAGNVGRNADELFRKLQACQFVHEHGDQVCPAKWKPGEKTITPSLDLVGQL